MSTTPTTQTRSLKELQDIHSRYLQTLRFLEHFDSLALIRLNDRIGSHLALEDILNPLMQADFADALTALVMADRAILEEHDITLEPIPPWIIPPTPIPPIPPVEEEEEEEEEEEP